MTTAKSNAEYYTYNNSPGEEVSFSHFKGGGDLQ